MHTFVPGCACSSGNALEIGSLSGASRSQLRGSKEVIQILHPDLAVAWNRKELSVVTSENNQKMSP